MRLGIIGLPQSGKTTLFNALTGGHHPTAMSAGRVEVHTAVVDVPDPRLEQLASILNSDKVTPARVTYADIAGLHGGSAAVAIAGPLLNQLSQMDGFLQVVRCFDDPNVPHPAGRLDPQRDIAAMQAELLLNDLIAVERKLERLDDEYRKGGRDRVQVEREKALFTRLQSGLSQEIPLRDMDFSKEEAQMLVGFGLLTPKPVLVVLNLAEGASPPLVDFPHRHSQVAALQGKLEMEIAQLLPDEAELFRQEYGIQEPGGQRIIHLSYDLLGLQTFFTGEPFKELRAWTVRKGVSAWEAAGEVHTDLQKGFIRAEVIGWEMLVELGGWGEARTQGRLRLEGKDYLVQDGDVIRVRFNL